MSGHLRILKRGDFMDPIKRTFNDSAITEFTQRFRAPCEINDSDRNWKMCYTILKIDGKFHEMVLEPKFVDYGSIHPTPDGHTHQVHHGVSGPRSALLSPLDDEDVTANASAGPKMTQGEFKSLLEFVFA
ncbi:uncharacterized protein LOC125505323 isoform X5 [Dendroctonus ponderosae]|uniref:uncharacterized protein LOC125505323 isoform X5 n=1 Tax=Dendroctonus ponderosae TaxID=77166 RepID=UPI002035F35E|nr:uncharacterized protein LOC125505323 isoform X5 [Dendroctonus ponderosae]